MTADGDLRALIREVIRDQLAAPAAPAAHPPPGAAETVVLATDEDLAVFVARLLTLDPAGRDDILAGRRRFRLQRQDLAGCASAGDNASDSTAAGAAAPRPRRIETGAVTERMIGAAARAGERLVLGPRAVLTPLARDRARASGVQIDRER